MKNFIMPVFLILALGLPAKASDGVITIPSKHDVKSTVERLRSVLNKKGMTIFKVVDHSQGAEKAGVDLRETQMVLFGNPRVGSPLMKCQQSVGIDLPQKALVWEDDKGNTWISYNDPKYLQKSHKVIGTPLLGN